MNLADALMALTTCLKNAAVFSDGNEFYRRVSFGALRPAADMTVPCVTFNVFGGTGEPAGLGDKRPVDLAVVQMDVLASNDLEAARLVQHVEQVVVTDLDSIASYLRGESVKGVQFDSPRPAPWDASGRVARLICGVTLHFYAT